VTTAAYRYAITDEQDRELFIWHWEPEGRGNRRAPHMHIKHGLGVTTDIQLPAASGVGEGSYGSIDVPGLHIPTGRILVEDVARFLIEELHVQGVPNYPGILKANIDAFRADHTWDHFSQIEERYGAPGPEGGAPDREPGSVR